MGTITSYPCDELEEEAFTGGDCWVLAYELWQRGAGELVTVTVGDDEMSWLHMAIQLPDGNILDIRGIQTPEQFLDTWQDNVAGSLLIVHTDLDTVKWSTLTQKMVPVFDSEDCNAYFTAEEICEWLELDAN